MREPTAGGFYPAKKKELEAMLKQMLSSRPKSCGIEEVMGAVVPHAGYYYSGRMAAKVYSLLKPCSTVIILGTNHTGLGEKAAISRDSWKTPLGVVGTDSELAEKIVAKGRDVLRFDEVAHSEEHSIEVQLPFLQHLFGKFRIVAISISSDMYSVDYKEIAEAIHGATKDSGINPLIIASSDFTHYGTRYGFTPAAKNAPEWVRETDMNLIDTLLHFDFDKFLSLGRETTACGIGPVATLISVMKKRAEKAELVDYTTSFDISGDDHTIVGYAGIVFGK